ncbi:flagellar motor protein MotB [Shewanella marina]|uniref:flagellar motor protein MotB n=1 Tax=Shewanella marina TaxID=487319 RepID=UPI0004708A87|nr:flagellar motor protein MotB [Shewanella marina]
MAKKAKCDCPPAGAPLWLATFADLMSLLMCFFVLLLAFSEMDVKKFKQLAGSMKYAFGVQNKIKVEDIPKGTSVIALEFRPGRPDPTPIDVVNQKTTEQTKSNLDYKAGEQATSGGAKQRQGQQSGGETSAKAQQKSVAEQISQAQVNEQVKRMAKILEQEIVDGAIEIESLGQQIIIRIREKGSFSSGSGFLQDQFKPVVHSIGNLLKDIPGIVTVSGFTDNVQIKNELHQSNWHLSTDRALAVANELLTVGGFSAKRMKVVGMASNSPLVANVNEQNRARNRRVEISISQGQAKESNLIEATGSPK